MTSDVAVPGQGVAGTRGVGDLVLVPVVSVRADMALGEAARVLWRTGAPFLRIDGTDRVLARDDVVRALADPDDGFDAATSVEVVARSTLLVVGAATPAIAVLGELVRCELPGVLVIDARNEVAGCLRMTDLVSALLEELALLSGLRHVLHVERSTW
jgi:predicted transcriptional regulator